MKIKLPPLYYIDANENGNSIRQLLRPIQVIEGTTATYSSQGTKGTLVTPDAGEEAGAILLLQKRGHAPDWHNRVLIGSTGESKAGDEHLDLSQATWLRHPLIHSLGGKVIDPRTHVEEVFNSWRGAFSFIEENQSHGVKGLRLPQIGALYAVHSHWTVSSAPATIVMPTGTGKTDTMLSVLVSTPCQKVLIVVPTDALRAQIAEKFLTLGILRQEGCSVLSEAARYPIVSILKHKPKDQSQVDQLFEASNVVITTSHIAGQCESTVQKRMAHHCPFLFIDEAHHAEARTWRAFKDKFADRHILQFTATPFREDDRLIDGKIIYKYPLKKAQVEGFFKSIRFRSVHEFNPANSDKAIAAVAIEQLRLDSQYKHILMARVRSVDRAEQVFQIYEKYKEFNPVQMHIGIKSQKERAENRRKILNGESRIIVCVDMLGEGFDLPELKIAAFHDIKKSLAVTLQLAGRFTRTRTDIGEATFVANVADVDVREELRKLYTRDPDWNVILPELSDTIIDEQISTKQFLEGFAAFSDEIPLKSLRPATSTVVYKTKCKSWTPENFRRGIPGIEDFARVHHSLNPETNTLVIVTARRVPIEWAEVEIMHNWNWELYVIIWDNLRNLLFINNSNNNSEFKSLAQAVAGEDVELVKEWPVFRCLAGVNRLKLTNVGLLEQLGRLVRYTGRMGADVEPALSEAQKRNTRKAVVFGTGFEGGTRVSVGASRKGRIWSFSRGRLNTLASWCKDIGAKVLDESIDPETIMRGTLQSEVLMVRPKIMPIGIDWPEAVYKETENIHSIVFEGGKEWALHETGIDLVSPTETGELRFRLFSEDDSIELSLSLHKKAGTNDYSFSVIGGRMVWLGRKSSRVRLEDFFYENPPVIWFADGSSLEGNQFTSLRSKQAPYDTKKIQAWDWTGIDLTKESQGVGKELDSIQFRVISVLRDGNYDVIYDDDGAGEAADVVAIRLDEQDGRKIIAVEFYHCKFSTKTPGQRIGDLYAVCGQAQKSICWMYSPDKQIDLFSHLLRREPKRRKGAEASRYEKGDREALIKIRQMSRISAVTLRIFVVQPGLSKENATAQQLELLSATENYLLETFKVPFGVISSQ